MTATAPGSVTEAANRRGRAFWVTAVAAGFLGVVVVASMAVVTGGEDHPSSPPATAAAAADSTADAAAASSTTTAAGPADALGDVRWEVLSGRAVPLSATVGPRKLTGPLATGYARTPEGAVIAALNIYARFTITGGTGWLDVTTAQVEPGKGRDVYVKARKTLDEVEAPAGGWGQTVGYRVVSYSKDRAVVEEAMRFDGGGMQAQTLTVLWRAGDRRLVLLPDGNASPPVIPLAGLDGFTPFSSGI